MTESILHHWLDFLSSSLNKETANFPVQSTRIKLEDLLEKQKLPNHLAQIYYKDNKGQLCSKWVKKYC